MALVVGPDIDLDNRILATKALDVTQTDEVLPTIGGVHYMKGGSIRPGASAKIKPSTIGRELFWV
jgi:hypothetical protein